MRGEDSRLADVALTATRPQLNSQLTPKTFEFYLQPNYHSRYVISYILGMILYSTTMIYLFIVSNPAGTAPCPIRGWRRKDILRRRHSPPRSY